MVDINGDFDASDDWSDPIQETRVLPNKDNDGHNYLKVLLFSNKKTRNNWIAPYKKISDIPDEVKKSFLGIPYVPRHDHDFYQRMQRILTASGVSHEEIHKKLIEESKKSAAGYVDFLFDNDPNSEVLYGQVKVTDPIENEYINKYNKPSKDFTSPAIYGKYDIADDGTMVYKLDTIRAFHNAGVSIPAFPEHEAQVKGVCKNGNSDTCSRALAFASFEPNIESVIQNTSPLENVNNSCGCNKDINMSTNQTAQQTSNITPDSGTAAKVTIPDGNTQTSATIQYNSGTGTGLLQGASQSTIDAMEKAKLEAAQLLNKQQQQEQEPKKTEEEKERDLELKELKKIIDQERNEKLEMRNFFLEELLTAHLPREGFKNDESYNTEKDLTKSFINKYNMGLEDAKWIIGKVAKSVQKPEEGNNNKKAPLHGVGTAGLYNPDNFLKNNTGSGTVPKPSSQSEFDDSDYPIRF